MRVITFDGCVGVGKTTIILKLLHRLIEKYNYSCIVIHEYIDVLHDAEQMLSDYLNNTISSYQFQNYILDYYDQQAKQVKDENVDFVLVERSPVEGIINFAKLDLLNNRLTNEEYKQLLTKAESIDFYPNITYDNSFTIDTSQFTIPYTINIIDDLITRFPFFHIIRLRANSSTIKERIIKRGRECEVKHYTDDYIKNMLNTYI